MRARLAAKRKRTWVAALAIYCLLLQTLVVALALGASASPLQRDALGNIICTSARGAAAVPGLPDRGNDHSNAQECCLAGCPMPGAALLPGRTSEIVKPHLPALIARVTSDHGRHVSYDTGRLPQNARAPPIVI